MKFFLGQLTNIGVHAELTEIEKKRVTLLNIFCLLWSLFLPLWVTMEVLYNSNRTSNIYTHVLSFGIILIVLVLQKIHWFKIARILFIFNLFYAIMSISYLNQVNYGAAFTFILIAPISLIFYDDKRVNYLFLLVSFLFFHIPISVFDNPSNNIWNSTFLASIDTNKPVVKSGLLIKIGLFYFVFAIVFYFKKMNLKGESLLASKNSLLKKKQDDQLRFFTNIAHELRTPLTIIRGSIAALYKKNPNYEELKRQVGALENLVSDIIDVSKIESNTFGLHKKRLEINELVKACYKNFESSFKQKQIEYSFKSKLGEKVNVTGDSKYLEKVINNVLSNALKFTPRAHKVSLITEVSSHTFVLKISDTGIGIPEKDHSFIFTRFYQVSNSYTKAGGSGIGLSFCKEIVELHDGTISFESQSGKGTTFIVELPVESIEADVSETVGEFSNIVTNNMFTVQGSRKYDILLVEDNLDMQTYLENSLDTYHMVCADNGKEALQLIEKGGANIKLIITDYMMPEMNGLEFIKQLKKQKIEVPVIVLSALSDSIQMQEMLSLGIYDYILKPFDLDELKIRIKNCLLRRNGQEEYEQLGFKTEDLLQKESLKKITQFIYSNCSNAKFGVEDISDYLSISKASLYRKVKLHSGLSTKEYITEVKLNKARQIIEADPSVSIKFILMETGWSNSSYFYDLYFDRFGINLRKRTLKV